jgi:hypothetical protein
MADVLDEVLEVLRSHRFLHSTERDLQDGIAAAMLAQGLDVALEVRLGGCNRIDLLVGRIGIEVKVAGSWRDVLRQVERYARLEQLDAVVLVTSKAMHTRLPSEHHGKPIVVHRVGSTL